MICLLQNHNVHMEHRWISGEAQLHDDLQGLDSVYTLRMANVGKVWLRQVLMQLKKKQSQRTRLDQKYLVVLMSGKSVIMLKI